MLGVVGVALTEELGLVSSMHMVAAHNHLQPQFQGTQGRLLASASIWGPYTHMQAKYSKYFKIRPALNVWQPSCLSFPSAYGPFLAQVRFCTIYRRQTSFLFEMLWIELRVSYMLGKHSTTELYSRPSIFSITFVHFFMFACVLMCVLLCKPWYTWKSSNNLQEELVLSFHHMDPRDQIGIIRLARKHLYPWAIFMAPFMILLSMCIYLCTSGAYIYHYYIHSMGQGEARGQLLGGSSLLSLCWGSVSLVPGPWASRWPACLRLLFHYRSVGITGSCRRIWLMYVVAGLKLGLWG